MIKMTMTNALISQGYNGAAALRFSEGENKFVRFRVGVSVYDKNADKNRRYVNINVKAFGGLCTRIENMKLDAGSYVNITGRYDEESWEDKNTHEKKSTAVLIADEIEFCHGGNGKQDGTTNGQNYSTANGQNYGSYAAPPSGGQYQPPPAGNGQQPNNFTGFEGFGAQNPYFPEG